MSLDLGRWDAVWRILEDDSITKKNDKSCTPAAVDFVSKLRQDMGRGVHAVRPSSLDTPPQLNDCASASEDDIVTSSDEDTSDRLRRLRDQMDKAMLKYSTQHERLEPRVRAMRTRQKLANMAVSSDARPHVFVDSSNLYLGFQQTLQDLHPKEYPAFAPPHRRPKMDLAVLATILERDRKCERRVLVGSTPLLQRWTPAERLGYEISLLERLPGIGQSPSRASGGTRKEQGVDELLHLKMLESVLDAEPGVMVLGTGDARQAQFSAGGFFACALRALARGWSVEVVAWSSGCGQAWFELKRQYERLGDAHFQLILLDDFVHELEA
ncbi:hypothetical protein PYCC9005_003963 [Savitreella phatthalungensis]